jgi:hypothetical protein
MLVLRQWKASAAREVVGRLQHVDLAVQPDFRPVLRPAREAQAAALNVSSERLAPDASDPSDRYRTEEQTLDAELYANGSDLVLLRVEAPSPRFRVGRSGTVVADEPTEVVVRCYGISGAATSAAVDAFVASAGEALGLPLEPTRYESARFDALAAEPGRTLNAVAQTHVVNAARTLSNRRTRSLAQAIKAAGGLLVGDLPKQVAGASSDEIAEIRGQLEAVDLIGSETVVVCKKTQVQIARAPSDVEVKAMAAAGVKCGCGRKISDERIEAALAVTDLGRELLDSSRWFSVMLHEELVRVGVESSRILLEVQQGGDEMDVLAEISGEIVFFELKDKEFSLGNAYSFGAKIGIIQPDHSVIVASDGVGNDAKDHFQRAGLSIPHEGRNSITGIVEDRPPQVQYIESVEDLPSRLDQIASAIYSGDVNRELARVLPRAMIDADALTNALVEDLEAGDPGPVRTRTTQRRRRSAKRIK